MSDFDILDYRPPHIGMIGCGLTDKEDIIFQFLLKQSLVERCVMRWYSEILEITGPTVLINATAHYFNPNDQTPITNDEIKSSSLINRLIWVTHSDIEKLRQKSSEDEQSHIYAGCAYSSQIDGTGNPDRLFIDLKILDALLQVMRTELPSIIV